MEPELLKGDVVLVWKPTIGARIFNILESIRGKQVEIYRIPGLKRIKRNDILVFNYPYQDWNKWEKIEMHIFKYYIKRCIALPGDTLTIKNGIYNVNNIFNVGNLESQRKIMLLNSDQFNKTLFYTYPSDSVIKWDIKNFGPMYIPQKGDSIPMNRINYLLYKKLIEWEQQDSLVYKDNNIYIKNRLIDFYKFKNNYYFMGGDNCLNSVDSRYWGLVPEDYIVGKSLFILKSINPETKKTRWNRFFKKIE